MSLRRPLAAAKLAVLIMAWMSACSAVSGLRAAEVLQTRNDPDQTGANLAETILTTATVRAGNFGRLYSYSVDGNIYAQPLLATVVQTGIGLRDVLYVVTTNNVVYAFDADSAGQSGGLIWSRRFGNPVASPRNLGTLIRIPYGPGVPVPVSASPPSGPISWNDPVHYENFSTTFEGNIGIVGTPVIDRGRNAIYFVARSKEGAEYVQTLHALDLGTGSELRNSPHEIARDSSPVGFAALENQRAGLTIVMNRVIVAWSGPGGREATQIGVNGQAGPYYGYVIAFDAATLAEAGCFTTGSQGHVMAGIWQSGRAPVSGSDGYIYLFTGNGWVMSGAQGVNRCNAAFPPARSLTNSIVKLDTRNGLQLAAAAADPRTDLLDTCDLDLGGSGPMRVPGTALMLGGGKQGVLHIIASASSGALQFDSGQQIYAGPAEDFGGPSGDLTNNLCKMHGMHHIMGGPTYWVSTSLGPIVYISAEDSVIRAFRLSRTFRLNAQAPTLELIPLSASGALVPVHPAAILSLSAHGSASGSGILWAVHSDQCGNPFTLPCRGILRAFDAENLTHELWNSDGAPGDGLGNFAKFAALTVANGRVYVPTFSGQVAVYGLLHAP